MPRSLLWPDPRVKPPFGAAEIDWGHPLAVGLRAYWPFNETGGSSVLDLAGQNIGTLTNGPVWASGIDGPALQFDGSDDYIDVGDTSVVDFGTGDFAFVVRVFNSAQTTRDILLGKDNNAAGTRQFFLSLNGDQAAIISPGRILLAIFQSDSVYFIRQTGDNVVPVNTWNHVCAQRRGGTIEIVLNGIAQATTTASGGGGTESLSVQATTAKLLIGARQYPSFQDYLIGRSDGVAIYNRGLLPEEVLQSYLEPYSMLRPIVRRRYFVPAAAGIAIPVLTRQYRERWS